jgi:hypothetical protein
VKLRQAVSVAGPWVALIYFYFYFYFYYLLSISTIYYLLLLSIYFYSTTSTLSTLLSTLLLYYLLYFYSSTLLHLLYYLLFYCTYLKGRRGWSHDHGKFGMRRGEGAACLLGCARIISDFCDFFEPKGGKSIPRIFR